MNAWPSILLTDCKSFYDAIHKEGAVPASTDKRLAIELAIIKAKAVSGETDLRWIDVRYQTADCLTKHASRKSEAVLQKILDMAQLMITAEEGRTAKSDGKTGLARRTRCTTFSRLMVRCIAGKKKFEECESERACNGTLDVLSTTR